MAYSGLVQYLGTVISQTTIRVPGRPELRFHKQLYPFTTQQLRRRQCRTIPRTISVMSVDRLLTTVLGLYRDVHDDVKTEQIYNTTGTLLTHLSNPLNVTLLTSNLLTAPAIWTKPDPLKTCYRIISIYNSAAIHVHRNEAERANQTPPLAPPPRSGGGIRTEQWVRAVAKGADDSSERWQHLLVLTGIFMGAEGGDRHALSHGLRNTLEQAIVTATNLALESAAQEGGQLAGGAVALALNYAFPLLSESSRTAINADLLLPVAAAALLGRDGLNQGLFLAAIDVDVRQAGDKFMWAETCASFRHFHQLQGLPLMVGLGPLTKLLAFTVERTRDVNRILSLQDDLVLFSHRLLQHWQRNKLSELEVAEAATYLTAETLRTTWPALWQFLRRILFAVVAVQNDIMARSLLDRSLGSDGVAPKLAVSSLNILRNLYFISSHSGNSAFQVYTFTFLTSIDLLVRYQDTCTAFLQSIKSPDSANIPAHPLQRTLDLFYLNVAEHLPLYLPPETSEVLIVQPATAYLTHSAPISGRMVELFEAAHSAILSVMSCPHNADLIISLAPFYADTLFRSFPTHISPRQFRLAFKTMMQILSPPFPISATHPDFAETLLEMVRFRVGSANPAPLPKIQAEEVAASEQSTLVMTLIDSLPFLPLDIFEGWLTLTADALNEIADPSMREVAKHRFWEILSNGEMDVERAPIGLAWWGSRGGRELVLFGRPEEKREEFVMSGAIVDWRGESKL